MAKVRIGVVSAANIGRKVVIPSILRAENAELVALASSGDTGASFLRETELDVRLHGSYDELLADSGVDAVYIPLPNHLHAEWSKRAADAGKHVLCEKPAALDAAETADMIEHCVGRGVVWMEAFMYRYHPQWAAVRRLLDEGAVGELRTVRSVFTFTVRDPANIRRRPGVRRRLALRRRRLLRERVPVDVRPAAGRGHGDLTAQPRGCRRGLPRCPRLRLRPVGAVR